MKNKSIDIIIPIYNAFDDLKICLDSIYKNTNLIKNRLILINDNSPDQRIKPFLDQQVRENVIVIHNEKNKGFSNNINIGMKQSSDNDVILLNSDTIVTSNWVEKLENCAYSDPAIGTVTPLSNNATLCSVPNFCAENTLPDGMTVEEAGKIIESCSLHKYPKITVAHGFCMLVKREVIRCVGMFDAETFGRGYGEENDFCNRAAQAGYHHVMCDDTYIYHSGTKSFVSKEKEAYIRAHDQILRERYPFQMKENDIHCRDNPNYFIGDNVSLYFDLYNGKRNILYLLQSDFRDGASDNVGGTQLHVRDLTNGLRETCNVFVAARDGEYLNLTLYYGNNEKTFRFYIGKLQKFYEFTNSVFDNLWRNILTAFHIELIHVHHVISTSFDIFYIAEEYGIPVVLTAHDFYFICPGIKLLNNKNEVCTNDVSMEKCKDCLFECFGITHKIDYMPLWREKCKAVLDICSEIVVPDRSAEEIFFKYYPEISKKIRVIEHGYDVISFDEYKVNTCSNDIIYSIEKIEREGETYSITGWGYDRFESRKINRIYISIRNTDAEAIIVASEKLKRYDVPSGSVHDEVGFRAVIPAGILNGNNLEIRVGVKKKNEIVYAMEVYKTVNLQAPKKKKLNIAFVGGLSKAKGGEEIYSIIKENIKGVNWYVFGSIGVPELKNLKQDNLVKTGGYYPGDLSLMLKEHQIDVIGILSIWPETYSYTVTEAILNQIPVIVTDIGALKERVGKLNCGWIIPMNDIKKSFLNSVKKILSNRDELEECKERLGKISIPTIKNTAMKYKALYDELWKNINYPEKWDTESIYKAYRKQECSEKVTKNGMEIQQLKKEMEIFYSSPTYKLVRKLWKVRFPGKNKLKELCKRIMK